MFSTFVNGVFIGIISALPIYAESEMETHRKIQEVVSHGSFYRMVLFYYVCMLIYKIHTDANTKEILSLFHQMNQQQVMVQNITENLDEGIIVKSVRNGLQYFNSKGYQLLQHAAELTGDHKQMQSALIELNHKIQNFEEIILDDISSRSYQDMIHKIKLFRVFSNNQQGQE